MGNLGGTKRVGGRFQGLEASELVLLASFLSVSDEADRWAVGLLGSVPGTAGPVSEQSACRQCAAKCDPVDNGLPWISR